MGSKIRSFSQHISVLGVGVNDTFSGSILQFKAGSVFSVDISYEETDFEGKNPK